MALQNGSILNGGTISVAGGTARTFTLTGAKVVNGVNLSDASNADITTRETITAKATPPQYDASSKTWSKSKKSMTVTIPVVKGTEQLFPSFFITLADHALLTQAEVDTLRNHAAQCIMDADFDGFWRSGNLT